MRSWAIVIPGITPVYLFLLASLQAISFGIVMEILQKLLTHTRHFDKQDIYANIGGAIVGAIIKVTLNKDS